jgi:acyl-CoA thioester hydrolase
MSTDAVTFHNSLTLRIDWSEMDQFGHINNVQYFKYTQAARVDVWEKIKTMMAMWEDRIGPNLASASCQFRKPLFYPGTVTIKSRLEFIKNTSFGLHHQLYNDTGELCAEARDVVVLFDFNKNEKVLIPDAMRTEMTDLLS